MRRLATAMRLLLASIACLPWPAGGVGALHGAHRGVGRAWPSPPLDPEGDRHFFRHDYPRDESPRVGDDHWNNPFPLVQDTNDFDKDYVKDENSDAGQWNLQMTYDVLRGHLTAARSAARNASDASDSDARELEALRRREAKARAKVVAALEAKRAAKQVQDEAEARRARELGGREVSDAELERQRRKVEEQEAQLKYCEKGLAEARAKLKQLQERRVKLEDEAREAAAGEEAAEEEQLEKEQTEAEFEEQATSAEKNYTESRLRHDKALAALNRTERAVDASEAKLRRFRQKEDPGGAVYNVDEHGNKIDPAAATPRSGGSSKRVRSSLAMSLAAVLAVSSAATAAR